MKSKIVLMAAFFACSAYTSYAQTSDAEADAIINLLGVQKREAVSKLVPVSGKDFVAFWKIYDEYLTENKKTAKARVKLYEYTADAYSNLTPAVANLLASRYFTNRMEQEKTLEAYYKRIKNATSPVVAFEFYQAEVYIQTLIRAQIMQQIPTYGQLVGA